MNILMTSVPTCNVYLFNRQMRRTVMETFRERANVAASLIDTDSIVQSLEQGFAGDAGVSSVKKKGGPWSQ
jgi:hypothetical protein